MGIEKIRFLHLPQFAYFAMSTKQLWRANFWHLVQKLNNPNSMEENSGTKFTSSLHILYMFYASRNSYWNSYRNLGFLQECQLDYFQTFVPGFLQKIMLQLLNKLLNAYRNSYWDSSGIGLLQEFFLKFLQKYLLRFLQKFLFYILKKFTIHRLFF